MNKTIVLFGGSFNPPHEGHLEMACYLQKTLNVDETWMMFSQSPFKAPAVYASLEHRINMANILAEQYDAPLVMSGLEAEIAKEKGRFETFYILQGLKERFPDNKFIWAMGADNFSQFHKWEERDDILASNIVAVIRRPGFEQAALESPTAKKFAAQKIEITDKDFLADVNAGWCFLNNPTIEMSSTSIHQKLAEGKSDFSEKFSKVADYIYEHGLYGAGGHRNNAFNPTYAQR